jgi:predicted nucleic acid-binding protein
LTRFVVDCSVTMAWCFADELDEYADSVLGALSSNEATVPSLWSLEVANTLIQGERRRRLTVADSQRFLDLLESLPIQLDGETATRATGATLAVGREYGLSIYDATYLELAMREGLSLATRDRRLRTASKAAGVPLFTLHS